MFEHGIARKLDTTPDAIQMLRTGSAVGRAVAAGLAARFGLDATTLQAPSSRPRTFSPRPTAGGSTANPPPVDRQ